MGPPGLAREEEAVGETEYKATLEALSEVNAELVERMGKKVDGAGFGIGCGSLIALAVGGYLLGSMVLDWGVGGSVVLAISGMISGVGILLTLISRRFYAVARQRIPEYLESKGIPWEPYELRDAVRSNPPGIFIDEETHGVAIRMLDILEFSRDERLKIYNEHIAPLVQPSSD